MSQRQFLSKSVSRLLCLVVALSGLVSVKHPALAAAGTRYVAPSGADGGSCLTLQAPCQTVQYAVDMASSGEVVKIAGGTYSGVQSRPSPSGYNGPAMVTQVVYLYKQVDLQGGYAAAFTEPPDPEVNATILDAEGQGRVLFVAGNIGPTVEGLTLTGGDADGLGGESGPNDLGGGAYISSTSATISKCRIVSNTADYGGGLALWGSDVTLAGNTISSNTAPYPNVWGGGGGLFANESKVELTGTVLSNNTTSGSGGGIHATGSDVTLEQNTVANNTAQSDGGGVYLNESPASISGNAVTGNSAGDGGGMHLWYSSATLSRNLVRLNRAENGGGLYLWGADAEATNTVVAENQASASGSGLHLTAAAFDFRHTTLVKNVGGDGSGVYVNGDLWWGYATLGMTNTIVANHAVGIYVKDGSTAALESTLWNGNTGQWAGAGTINHTNDHSGSPAFIDPSSGDYHIAPSSAALDIGVDAGVTEDLDGEVRPLGAGFDLGADEMAPLAPPTLHAISNPGLDDDYSVTWAPVAGATSYTLQEDDNLSFPTPATRSQGAGTFYHAVGQGGGTWFYRVRATGPTGTSSWSTIESVSVDRTPPSSSVSSPPYDRSQSIPTAWTAGDPAPSSGLYLACLWYKLNSAGSWMEVPGCQAGSSGTFAFEPPGGTNGTYYFQTIAQDSAGNLEPGPAGNGDDSTLFDSIPPTSQADSPPDPVRSESFPILWLASDALSGLQTTCLWYRLGAAGSWTKVSGCQAGSSGGFAFEPPGGANGTYNFQTIAKDNAGNLEPGPSGDGDDSTLFDSVPPTSQADSPSDSSLGEVIPIPWLASDMLSGLQTTCLWYKAGESGSWAQAAACQPGESGTFFFPAPATAGSYYFQSIATDNAGNTEPGPADPGDTQAMVKVRIYLPLTARTN